MVIVFTVAGDTFCEDCYRDLRDPMDGDASMFVARRARQGRCQCCGESVG